MFNRITGEWEFVRGLMSVDGGGNENGSTGGDTGSTGSDDNGGGDPVGSVGGLVDAGGAVLGGIGPGALEVLGSGQIDSLNGTTGDTSTSTGSNGDGNDGGAVSLQALFASDPAAVFAPGTGFTAVAFTGTDVMGINSSGSMLADWNLPSNQISFIQNGPWN